MAPAISGARRDREKGEPLRRLKVGSGSSGGGERERTGSAPALPVRFFSFSAARPSLTLRGSAQSFHRSTVPPLPQRRRAQRLPAPLCRLLITVGKLDESRFIECSTKNRHSCGKCVVARVAHGH